MLSGRKYRLGKPTVAMTHEDGKRTMLTVPSDAVIEIVSGPSHSDEDALVKIRWEDKIVSMFAVDIEMRGTPLTGSSATA